MTMTVQEVIAEMREWDSIASREWADALERAMQQPVAEVRACEWGWCMNLLALDAVDHGTKLYAFPPDVGVEVERLRELLGDCVDRMKRARKLLQDEYRDKGWSQEQINLHANWGMLDTTRAEAALAGKEVKP